MNLGTCLFSLMLMLFACLKLDSCPSSVICLLSVMNLFFIAQVVLVMLVVSLFT